MYKILKVIGGEIKLLQRPACEPELMLVLVGYDSHIINPKYSLASHKEIK